MSGVWVFMGLNHRCAFVQSAWRPPTPLLVPCNAFEQRGCVLQVQQPPPAPLPQPSCNRWKMTAYPVNNDGTPFVLYGATGDAVKSGVKDVSIVRITAAQLRDLP
jgi:hypothetical protein